MAQRLSILDAIGDTPLIEFQHIVPQGSARVLAKLESANPTGSMKDRMARAAIERAAADGPLGPDRVVVTIVIDSGFRYLSTDVYRIGQRRRKCPVQATTQAPEPRRWAEHAG